jgi:hypothetical protein
MTHMHLLEARMGQGRGGGRQVKERVRADSQMIKVWDYITDSVSIYLIEIVWHHNVSR